MNGTKTTHRSSTVATVMELATPVGACTVIVTHDTVIACGFSTEIAQLMNLIHPSLRPSVLEHHNHPVIETAIDRYFDGDVVGINAVPVLQRSTPLRERGWEELRKVGAGDAISYGELAKRMDMPRGARAAGQVCARNAVSLFIPCHRVVAADGSLNHYAWGLPIKRWLLEFESACR
jgi:methylated-DNA-[protein]-cysteine S-methyltransferase